MAEGLAQLLDRVRGGDESAAAVLIDRFSGSAQRLAVALLGDTHYAQDAVQEAFITALHRLIDLRTPEAFPGWFWQIVRTECRRIARRHDERTGVCPTEAASTEPSPPEVLERSELRNLVRTILAKLPPAGRKTAELYYIQERSIAEIAAALDVPSGTVKRRLHDARIRLRNLLSDAVDIVQPPQHRRRPVRENDLL